MLRYLLDLPGGNGIPLASIGVDTVQIVEVAITVEPPSKGHFGTNHSVHYRKENVLFSEVFITMEISTFGTLRSVSLEVVPFSECPLLEISLYS